MTFNLECLPTSDVRLSHEFNFLSSVLMAVTRDTTTIDFNMSLCPAAQYSGERPQSLVLLMTERETFPLYLSFSHAHNFTCQHFLPPGYRRQYIRTCGKLWLFALKLLFATNNDVGSSYSGLTVGPPKHVRRFR